ncbi:2-hydroxycarboxylate transporter family protein [Candidatus Phytoplasma pini]|uniref:Malate (Citrate)/Na+ symporter n=1 Tax=Candidatus Phytoplasma pini TaxID=267362 RepID=A0A559KJH9_9MOLU|nr:2-hydroxycarboxylate transporter family protein [Candidatus Phytoplasma pini]TVY12286.1 Malate (citrate)/Na+ symporter [Candidatus Phytoplasma pini]
MQKIKKNIFGFHPLFFLILIFLIFFNLFYINNEPKLWHPLLTPLFLIMVLGFFLNFIGENIPFFNKLGLGFLLCILIPSYLVHKGLINKKISEMFDYYFFNKPNSDKDGLGINFAQFFIIIIVSGSIISLDIDFLKKSLHKLIFLTLIAILISILIIGVIGYIFNYECPDIFKNKTKGSFWDSIFFVAVPLTNGGTNLGINGFSNGIYKEVFKNSSVVDIKSVILAPLILTKVLSIFFAGLLYFLFDNTKYSSKNFLGNEKKIMVKKFSETPLEYQNIGSGLLIVCSLYSISSIINYWLCQKIRFKLDIIVFVIFILLIMKFFNLISFKYQNDLFQTGKFMNINFMFPALVGLGLTTKFDKLRECMLNPIILLMVIISLLTTIILVFIFSKWFEFYPLESALISGICAYSIGSTGNIAVMEISHRSYLLPFAMIITRTIGIIIYILASIIFPILYMR